MAEIRKHHGGEPHARQNGDVDLRMAEEPEEMQPKQWRAVARPSSRMKDAIDEVSRGKKEARSGVAIAEEQEKRGKQNRKGKNAKQRSCKPSPYGQWKPVPAHAL